jgi:hypothetical protein
MAADCKSAALTRYAGSNPAPTTQSQDEGGKMKGEGGVALIAHDIHPFSFVLLKRPS